MHQFTHTHRYTHTQTHTHKHTNTNTRKHKCLITKNLVNSDLKGDIYIYIHFICNVDDLFISGY